MKELVVYMCFAASGYYAGSKIRNNGKEYKIFGVFQNIFLMIMVVLMGIRMGSNEEVIDNLSTIGVTSLVITIFSMVFTVLAIFITRKLLGIDRYAHMIDKPGEGLPVEGEILSVENVEQSIDEPKEPFYKSMTFRILIGVAFGMSTGYLVIRRVFADSMDDFNNGVMWGIRVGLAIMLVFVGLDMGIAGTIGPNLKKVGLRVFAFPIAVMAGTFFGVGLCSLFMDFTLRECLAVGAGFGWYTLAPGLIMERGFITVSAVSFLHNVMRENLAIVIIPLVAKRIGYIECTGLAGSASMDFCLLIAQKVTNSETVVYSFIIGLVINILIPIMVPLFIGA